MQSTEKKLLCINNVISGGKNVKTWCKKVQITRETVVFVQSSFQKMDLRKQE